MGCWNATCCLSGIAISHGERMVCIVIHEPVLKDYNNCVYAFTPMSLPLYGTYNDYGCIENIDRNSFAASTFVNRFKELMDAGDIVITSSRYDAEVDITDIHSILNAIERDRVARDGRKLSFFFANEDVLKKSITVLKESLVSLSDLDDAKNKYVENCKINESFAVLLLAHSKFVSYYLNLCYRFASLDEQERMAKSLITSQLLDSDREAILTLMKTDHLLRVLRRCWEPQQSGVGSQYDNCEELADFSKIVLEVCERKMEINRKNMEGW